MAPCGPQKPRRQGDGAGPPASRPPCPRHGCGWLEAIRTCSRCHRIIHATLTNKELEPGYPTAEALRANPEIAKFVAWVSNKEPDFHAPTRRRKV